MDHVDFTKLHQFNVHHKEAYFNEAFSRNIGLLTEQEQEILKNARVAIPGMGGVGGLHLIAMVRSGVGKFSIADMDLFEPGNVNRQYGATVQAFGRPKAEVMREQALAINPFVEIDVFSQGVTAENIDVFLKNVDVVIDGLDFFNFEIRRLLFNKAREKGIFVVTAAPLGFSAALLVFSPSAGMAFDDYFHIVEDMQPEEQYLAFAMGLAPRPTHIRYMDLKKVSFETRAGPSLGVACLVCAGMAGSSAIQIILKKGKIKPVPHYIQFDPYLMKFRKGRLFFGNRNPLQRIKLRIAGYLLSRNKKKYFVHMPPLPHLPSKTDAIPDDVVAFLLQAGIQAPSGDNIQPWRFATSRNAISVYLDRAADTCFFNVHQIASIISCGAVIENIKIAASNFGIETRVHGRPDPANPDLMAKLDFAVTRDNKTIDKDILFDSIWERRTDRQVFRAVPVPSHCIEKLSASISDFSGTRLHVITEKAKIKAVAKMIYAADRIRIQNKSLHEHFYRMIRFTDLHAQIRRDGMPLKSLQAGMPGEWLLRSTRSWTVMNMLNKLGIDKPVAFHSYKAMVRSPALALLTVDQTNRQAFLTGGRALQRAWLTLNHLGLAIQPMTAVTLFGLRWELEGRERFSTKEQKIFAPVWDQFQKIFSAVDWKVHGPIMLFRFGYSRPPTIGTLRKGIGDLMAPNGEREPS